MKKKLTDNERALFNQAMQNVKRFHSEKVLFSKTPNKASFSKQVKKPESEIYLSDYEGEIVAADDELTFSRSGVQPRYLRQLRNGELPVAAELDLHGFTIEQAREKLLKFIQLAHQRGWRVVRIIHGKGMRGANTQPILKNKVNAWLRQIDFILAFCSAMPKTGGKGAVNVLMRKIKNPI